MRKLNLIFLLVAFAAFFKPGVSFGQDFLVVGNDTGNAYLTNDDLVSIFKPKNNRWENNRPIIIVLPGSGSDISEVVARRVYGKSFVAVQKYWLSLVFQGRFNAPYFFNTDEEVLNFIRKNPGAIGFVSLANGVPENLLIRMK
ncbi:MAG: substrate-binding domain-containing protein [Cyclobacteriaceae bacterium]